MEENLIKISEINDFIFCPVSIYFHKLHGELSTIYYHTEKQILGKKVHSTIDNNNYTSKDILKSLDVYSQKYNLIGKIDIYNKKTYTLTERKKHVKTIYDGYIFQLYAQGIAMEEMGYKVEKMQIYSYDDNKIYNIETYKTDIKKYLDFKRTIKNMRKFKICEFIQKNKEKCLNCIYETVCDRSLL